MAKRMWLIIYEALGVDSDEMELDKYMVKDITSRLEVCKNAIPHRIYTGQDASFNLEIERDKRQFRDQPDKWSEYRAVSEYTLGLVDTADFFIGLLEKIAEETKFSNGVETEEAEEAEESEGNVKHKNVENHINVDDFPSAQESLEISRTKKGNPYYEQISKDLYCLFNKINEASHRGENLIVLDNYFDDSNCGGGRIVERIASSDTIKRILVDKGYRVSFETQKKYFPGCVIHYIEGRISWDKHPDFFEDDWDTDKIKEFLNE